MNIKQQSFFLQVSKPWLVWKCLKGQLKEWCVFTCIFQAFSQLVAKSIFPVSFCMLSDYRTANISFSPVHMTAWQPLIHLHFSVIFQRWSWEALRLHKSGRLEDSMDPSYLILNCCSWSIITTNRPKFKFNQSTLLNMYNNSVYLFWFVWHKNFKKWDVISTKIKALKILSCSFSKYFYKNFMVFHY